MLLGSKPPKASADPKPAAEITEQVNLDCLVLHQVPSMCLARRWEAVYRLIPDERPIIEQTLKQLVGGLGARPHTACAHVLR